MKIRTVAEIEFIDRCAEYYVHDISNYFLVDDGFGNLWEAAGSYYDQFPKSPMLHNRMMIMNTHGRLMLGNATNIWDNN